MSSNRTSAALGLGVASLSYLMLDLTPLFAASPKDIIAIQIRRQGYECKNPQSAERDKTRGNPDDPIWILKCEGVSYRVHLIPNMAATVERLPEEDQGEQQP